MNYVNIPLPSLDLSPIVHLWDVLKLEIYNMNLQLIGQQPLHDATVSI